MFKKFKLYLYNRLRERSTQVAMIGLLPFILRYTNIPQDMINPIVNVVAAFLVTAVVTRG